LIQRGEVIHDANKIIAEIEDKIQQEQLGGLPHRTMIRALVISLGSKRLYQRVNAGAYLFLRNRQLVDHFHWRIRACGIQQHEVGSLYIDVL